MKKLFLLVLIFSAIVLMGSCTNNEGAEDIDVITPVDSTLAKVVH